MTPFRNVILARLVEVTLSPLEALAKTEVMATKQTDKRKCVNVSGEATAVTRMTQAIGINAGNVQS